MPTNEILFYDVDPMSIIPTGTGDTFTWTGPATATGSATITDTEPGIEGQTLDDDSNGNESATADVTVGGQSSTGSDADAERAWTVRDLNTGEEFQIVEFDVEDGDAAGSYTLSEKPLDPIPATKSSPMTATRTSTQATRSSTTRISTTVSFRRMARSRARAAMT